MPIKLHSSYNPQKEAERFCNTINGMPKIIIITEPGESYLAEVLRKKFPETKLIAIRYTDTYFLLSDKFWDAVWRPAQGNLDFFLLRNIPDELLCVSLFLSWKPAETVWPETFKSVWTGIASSIKIMQSVIATRDFFGRRWLKNITDNFLFAENPVHFEFLTKDSLFTASGGSLKTVLKNNRNTLNKKFIVASSSSISALSAYGITPDLCIATDGGFWAAGHIKNISADIPIAFPPEAKIPYNVLKKNPCVFLTYGSLIEYFFFSNFNIPFKKAKRNGTVSGTAAELLLDYTRGTIYISGLDLEGTKGFSHVQPHESLKSKEAYFSKLYPISQFAAVSNFDTRSLEVYANWFSQLEPEKSKRIRRIGFEGKNIESIKRISFEKFNDSSETYTQKKIIRHCVKKNKSERKDIIYDFYKTIEKNLKTGIFLDKLMDGLKREKEKYAENELCELISFQSYIKLIKENAFENTVYAKTELQNKVTQFVKGQLKRLKDERS